MTFQFVNIIPESLKIVFEFIKMTFQFVRIISEVLKIVFQFVKMILQFVKMFFEVTNFARIVFFDFARLGWQIGQQTQQKWPRRRAKTPS